MKLLPSSKFCVCGGSMRIVKRRGVPNRRAGDAHGYNTTTMQMSDLQQAEAFERAKVALRHTGKLLSARWRVKLPT